MLHEISAGRSADLSQSPVVGLAIAFIGGILTASFKEIPILVFVCSGLVSVVTALLTVGSRFCIGFVLSAFFCVGGFCFLLEKDLISPDRLRYKYDSGSIASGEPVEITGIVTSRTELAIDGVYLFLDLDSISIRGRAENASGVVRVFVPASESDGATRLEYLFGDRLRVLVGLEREESFRNPGGVSRIKILDQQGIDAVGSVKSKLLVELIGTTTVFLPSKWLFEWRQGVVASFRENLNTSTSGVMIASMLGNKHHLDKATAESFREGGTFHLLVISGLHITFIGGIVVMIISRLTTNRGLRFAVAAFVLWAYAIAVGAEPPVIRAALMFTLWLFSDAIFRSSGSLNTLAICAVAILCVSPSDIFNPSVHLTFLAVFAIVGNGLPLLDKLRAIGEWHPMTLRPAPPNVGKTLKTFCECLYWSEKSWQHLVGRSVWECALFKSEFAVRLEKLHIQRFLRFLFESVAVSVLVQIWLLPLSVVYFHRISPFAVFHNLWVGFVLAIESIAALSGVVLSNFSLVAAAPFFLIAEILNSLILQITGVFNLSQGAEIRLPHYSGAGRILYFVYFLPLIMITMKLLDWNPFVLKRQPISLRSASPLAGLLMVAALIVFHPFRAPFPDGNLRVDFLDVGQGDCALITMPTGETILIDGGGRPGFSQTVILREGETPEAFTPDVPNIGENVVSAFLWERGYSRIDYLLATHPDTDHIQGLGDVAENFEIGAAIVARTPSGDPDFASFHRILERNEVPVIVAAMGNELNFGGVRIEVINPEAAQNADVPQSNDDSLVFRVVFGETAILFTGDIEKSTERRMIERPGDLRADVVKVAHHGSRTSSTEEFVAASQAKAAIISVGRRSQFGHPHPEVVERWESIGAKVLRTGETGTISLVSDGKTLKLTTFQK
jgi:competence protein ComEC